MTYIDIREVWIEAAFREVSLENIHIGDPVEIVLDIFPGRIIAGRVAALGYGVGNRERRRAHRPAEPAQPERLDPPAAADAGADRVRPAGRPAGLRVGSQAKVMVYPGENAIMNALGYIRMRLAALLAYVQ